MLQLCARNSLQTNSFDRVLIVIKTRSIVVINKCTTIMASTKKLEAFLLERVGKKIEEVNVAVLLESMIVCIKRDREF